MPVDRHVETRRFQSTHRRKLIGDGKRIEHRGKPGVEYPVEYEHKDLHGKNDIKDVVFANSLLTTRSL